MARRGNGEGTITRRKDGRWEARYYVQTVNGAKRKVLYGKTRAEARDKLAKALSDRIDGIVYDDENMTLGEYLDVWLKGSVFGSVRQSTYDRDTNLVNNHIKPVLGGLKLKKLNSAQVQSFYRDRLDAGLSGSTVHKMHDILRRGLAQAVKWHLVPRNVAEAAKPPRPAPKEMQALFRRRGTPAARSSRRSPSRSVVRPRHPYRHEARRTAGAQVAGRGPGEHRREREAHADQERRESGVRRAEDQKEPPVHPPHPASRGSIEGAPEAPATGHGDPRRPLPGSGARFHYRHGSAD
jgi:integrase-like protein